MAIRAVGGNAILRSGSNASHPPLALDRVGVTSTKGACTTYCFGIDSAFLSIAKGWHQEQNTSQLLNSQGNICPSSVLWPSVSIASITIGVMSLWYGDMRRSGVWFIQVFQVSTLTTDAAAL